jgi:cytosine deaminase
MLTSRGVQLEHLNDHECIEMMGRFIRENPKLWNEDIGE